MATAPYPNPLGPQRSPTQSSCHSHPYPSFLPRLFTSHLPFKAFSIPLCQEAFPDHPLPFFRSVPLVGFHTSLTQQQAAFLWPCLPCPKTTTLPDSP